MANNSQIISKQKNNSTQNDSNISKVIYNKRKHFNKSDYHKRNVIKLSQYSGNANVSKNSDSYLETNIIKSRNSSLSMYDDLPLSQSSELHLGQKYEDYSQCTRDIGTMTEDRDSELEKQCNELFGRIVACEISNIKGSDRFNKMKEILDVLQKIKL
ncbi:PREDICTED: uncharacterized protein LOC106122798 [Papilio xuthus]|uniref:Uncharacterized protein LOC106122798 n=1 Tax=Papilio xuthus TaxID=66420 RepID=A0AAJ6ZKL0_PAPXU|nr:PREDICTED: uncharacterized protein LOC106122798 [Papilio xuthus]